jgi:hypothetical protein
MPKVYHNRGANAIHAPWKTGLVIEKSPVRGYNYMEKTGARGLLGNIGKGCEEK